MPKYLTSHNWGATHAKELVAYLLQKCDRHDRLPRPEETISHPNFAAIVQAAELKRSTLDAKVLRIFRARHCAFTRARLSRGAA